MAKVLNMLPKLDRWVTLFRSEEIQPKVKGKPQEPGLTVRLNERTNEVHIIFDSGISVELTVVDTQALIASLKEKF